ncbi:MAG: ankyrin repeat domain-containing protein, partial [Elusimicrobia bacterium]|nr:ankyrin repeat domain-containing protein [Elusimicrobiota bacterium]
MKMAIAALAVMAVAGAAPLMARQAGFSAGESGFSSQVRAGFLAAGRQAGLFRAAARKASAERRVNALVQYAADGNLPMVKALLAQGVDVNAKSDYGPAALSAAAVNNRAEVVRYLLDRGADPNAAARHPSPGYYGDASGVAPLMLIASNRIFDVRMAFDLLAHGAAVDARDSLGDTALMYAAQGGAVSAPDAGSHLDLIKLLLAHHA